MHRKCEMKQHTAATTTSGQENFKNSRENLVADQKTSNWTLAAEPYQSQYLWSENSTSEQSILASNLTLANSQKNPEIQYGSNIFNSTTSITNQLQNSEINKNGSNISLNNHQPQSTSCLDLSNNNIYQGSDNRKGLLPLYRPAPDYETAVQQKYRASSSDLRLSTPMIQVPPEMMSDHQSNIYGYESHTDLHKLELENVRQFYPDVTQTTNPIYSRYCGVDGNNQQQFKLLRLAKPPPPPYPVNRISSTSTPDLALASQRGGFGYRGVYVSGSSPDLVSTRNCGRYQKTYPLLFAQTYAANDNTRLTHSQNYLTPHGTIEQLNVIDHTNYNQQPQIHHNMYEGNKFIYCMPRNVDQIYIHDSVNKQPNIIANTSKTSKTLPSHSQIQNTELTEPIYENVPFSWQNDNNLNKRTNLHTQQQQQDLIKNNDKKILKLKSPAAAALSSSAVNLNDNNQIQIDNNINKNQIKNSGDLIDNNQISKSLTEFKNLNISYSSSKLDTIANISQSSSAMNYSTPSILMNSPSQSSIAANDTIKVEKRKKRWGILNRAKIGGGSKDSSKNSDKLKSASLGREKDKNKNKNPIGLDESGGSSSSSMKQRWSTGLPKSQSLPIDISKEKLVIFYWH